MKAYPSYKDSDVDVIGSNSLLNEVELVLIIDLLFTESNPAGIKAALEITGICESHVRLPLVRSTVELKQILKLQMGYTISADLFFLCPIILFLSFVRISSSGTSMVKVITPSFSARLRPSILWLEIEPTV